MPIWRLAFLLSALLACVHPSCGADGRRWLLAPAGTREHNRTATVMRRKCIQAGYLCHSDCISTSLFLRANARALPRAASTTPAASPHTAMTAAAAAKHAAGLKLS